MNYPKGHDKCDVIDEMDDLCQQLERITKRIRVLQLQQKAEELQQECKKTIVRKKKKGVSVGDSVVITNKYQGLQGTIGDVVRINNSFVTVETADGRRIVRGHQNVVKL